MHRVKHQHRRFPALNAVKLVETAISCWGFISAAGRLVRPGIPSDHMQMQNKTIGRTGRLQVRAHSVVPSQVIQPSQTVKVPNIALKEWSVAIGALRDGAATYVERTCLCSNDGLPTAGEA